jgi:hypothetical protein
MLSKLHDVSGLAGVFAAGGMMAAVVVALLSRGA